MNKEEKDVRKLSMDELNRKSVEEFRQSEKIPIIAVLENVRSAYNVGTVFRTADAFLLKRFTSVATQHTRPIKKLKKQRWVQKKRVHWKHFKNISEGIEELKAWL